MPLITTTIGAFPKPGYVPISDWFSAPNGTDASDPTRDYEAELARAGGEVKTSSRAPRRR